MDPFCSASPSFLLRKIVMPGQKFAAGKVKYVPEVGRKAIHYRVHPAHSFVVFSAGPFIVNPFFPDFRVLCSGYKQIDAGISPRWQSVRQRLTSCISRFERGVSGWVRLSWKISVLFGEPIAATCVNLSILCMKNLDHAVNHANDLILHSLRKRLIFFFSIFRNVIPLKNTVARYHQKTSRYLFNFLNKHICNIISLD